MTLDDGTLKIILSIVTLITTIGGVGGVWAVLRSEVASLKQKDEKREAAIKELDKDFGEFREHAASNFVTYQVLGEMKAEMVSEVRRVGARMDQLMDMLLKRGS